MLATTCARLASDPGARSSPARAGELNFNIVGVAYQMASILSESTRLVMVQILLQVRLSDLVVCRHACEQSGLRQTA